VQQQAGESQPIEKLPEVDAAVLADMSGVLALSQEALWQALGEAQTGQLSAWALSEAGHMERDGVDPRDAFIQGVGYAVTALARQLARNNSKDAVAALLSAQLRTAGAGA
jgi:hypothetical protein